MSSRVEARDGHDPTRILAAAPTELRRPRAGTSNPFRVSISPSGHTVLALGSDPWGPSTILDVTTGTSRVITPMRVSCRLLDDTTLIGLGVTSNESLLEFSTMDISAEQIVYKSNNQFRSTLTSGSNDLYLSSAKPGEPPGAPRLLFVADQAGVHVTQFPDYPAVSARRNESLWPHETGRVTRIGISPDSGKLFLATGNHALVFSPQLSPPKTFPTTFWSVAVTSDACYTVVKDGESPGGAGDNIMLIERRFDQNRPRAFALAWPSGTPSQPWGLAVTPDGRTAAILCQESDNTTVSGSFYEKHLLIYELPPNPPTDRPVAIARKIHLRELSGADGRGNGRPILSPDGKTLFFYTSTGECFAYAVETGGLIWSASTGGSIAVSPSGELFASGDYRDSAPIEVRDIATGRVIYSTPGSYKVRKLALTFDHKLLAAVEEETLLTIDLASGAESSRRSLLCPVAVSPDGTRLVAFLPEEPGLLNGSTVLADAHSGRIIEVLNTNAHLLNFATFTPQGDRIVLSRIRYSVSMITADPWERLAAALEVPGYPVTPLPRNATAAEFASLHPPPLAPLPATGSAAEPSTSTAGLPLPIDATNHAQLAAHLDSAVTVVGTVRTAEWSVNDSIFNMDFETNEENGLLVVIFPRSRAAFESELGGDLEQALTGKSIEIKGRLISYGGKIEEWKNRPQIILHSPSQLRLRPAAASPETQ